MGSEFAYEDISSQEVEKYAYKWLRDETMDGKACFVSELYPVDKKNSGYKKLLAWIDKDEYRTWKIEYLDRKNSLLKTLTFKDYKQYLGKYWRANVMEMINHQNGKSTVLTWENYKFGVGLKDDDFSQNSLKRAR